MDLIAIIEKIYALRAEYKGTSLMYQKLQTDEEFKRVIEQGIITNQITGFSEEEWNKIANLNMMGKGTLEDAFKVGANIGACTSASRLVSYIFAHCYIAGGTNSYLVNTQNSPDGRHTWIVDRLGNVYDTTFMIKIKPSYVSKCGYVEENRYNPNQNSKYRAAKDYANDLNIKRKAI